MLALVSGCVWDAAPMRPAPAERAPAATALAAPAVPAVDSAAALPDPPPFAGKEIVVEEEEKDEEEELTRPERQWRWIRNATDDGCRDRLRETEAKFHALDDRERPDPKGCGIPRGVILQRGPTGLRYSPPLRVDCSFALRLGQIETLLQEEAKAHFGAEVARVGTLGSYVCRGVVGRLRGWSGGISEHGFGNAVDVTHFDLVGGRRVSVLRHYPAAARDEGVFLRRIVGRVWRDLDMRALGPDFDPSHRDHLHFDAGSRWWR
jgi:hypothetical protein